MLYYDIYLVVISFLPSHQLLRLKFVSKEFKDICEKTFSNSNSFLMRAKTIHDKLSKRFFKRSKLDSNLISWTQGFDLNQLHVLGAQVSAKVENGFFEAKIVTLWNSTFTIVRKLCSNFYQIIAHHCLNNNEICYHLQNETTNNQISIIFQLLPYFEIKVNYKFQSEQSEQFESLCNYFTQRNNSDHFHYYPDVDDLTQIVQVKGMQIHRIKGQKIGERSFFYYGSESVVSVSKNCLFLNNLSLCCLHLGQIYQLEKFLNLSTKLFNHYEMISLNKNIILIWVNNLCHIFAVLQNLTLSLIGIFTPLNKLVGEIVLHNQKDNCLLFIYQGKVKIYDLSILTNIH